MRAMVKAAGCLVDTEARSFRHSLVLLCAHVRTKSRMCARHHGVVIVVARV